MCEIHVGVRQDSSRERDFGLDVLPSILLPERNVRGIIIEINHILMNTEFAFKHMDKEMFRKICATLDPKSSIAAPVWSSHLKKHKDLLERV